MQVQESFGILSVVASAGLTVAGGVAVFHGYGPGGLPRCNPRAARDKVGEIIAQSPMGRVLGLSIHAVDNVVALSTAAGRVVCTANAILRDNITRRMGCQFWNRGLDRMVDDRFEP